MKSKIPHVLTKITPFSRTVALILFFFLPIMGFLIGFCYGLDIGKTSAYPTINSEILKDKKLVPLEATASSTLTITPTSGKSITPTDKQLPNAQPTKKMKKS